MNKTIDYYNTHAAEFAVSTQNADMSPSRDLFVSYVKPGGKILDAGCGTGRDSKAFLEMGYSVDAFDASEEMCRIAEINTGIPVKKQTFEDFCEEDKYDGIWACASLLHVNEKELPDILERMKKALKIDGVMYLSFKYGEGEHIRGERFFTDMNEVSLRTILESADFEITDIYITDDVRKERKNEKWANAIVRKAQE